MFCKITSIIIPFIFWGGERNMEDGVVELSSQCLYNYQTTLYEIGRNI